MFKLAFRMFRSDIRTIFQGWAMGIVLLLCLFIWGVAPFVEDYGNVAYMAYAWMTSLIWVAPRFTKVCHVVPFTIGQMKKLAIYRILLLVLVLIGSGGVVLVVATLCHWKWNPHFGLWYFLYVEVYTILIKDRIAGFYKKGKKNLPLSIYAGIIMVASIFVMLGMFDFLPLYVEYLIQTVLFVLYIPYIIYVFKEMDFYDYKQVTGGFGGRPEFMT